MFSMKKYLRILALMSWFAGMNFNQTACAIDSTKAVEIPIVFETQLPNGLKINLVEHKELPIIAIHFMIKAGAIAETAECAGLTNLTIGCITSGTKNRTAEQVTQALDYMGTSIDYKAGWDASSISCPILKWDFDTILELLSDMFLYPSFDDKIIASRKEKALAALQTEKNDAAMIAGSNMKELIFGAHPYGRSACGTINSLNRINKDKIVRFYQAHFVPNNTVLSVVGDFKKDEILEKISNSFKYWKNSAVPEIKPPAIMSSQNIKIRLIHRAAVQLPRIQMGHLGCEKFCDDYEAMLVMNHIFGGFNLDSRLTSQIREKKALVDIIISEFDSETRQCPFIVSAGAQAGNITGVVQSVLHEALKLQQQKVSTDELNEAKTHFITEYSFRFETPLQIAEIISEYRILGIDFQRLHEFTARINALTADDIQSAAKKYLNPDKMLLVVVGNKATVAAELRKLDDVELVGTQSESGISAMRTILKKKR